MYDLIIIGGGISGLGLALQAAQYGLAVALFERDVCCGATSANSLRIFHGGLRYLQHLNFRRALESQREQVAWLRNAPELIKPLPCLMPLSAFGLKSRFPAGLGCAVFNMLSCLIGRERRVAARLFSKAEAEREAPELSGLVPHGALFWLDAQIEQPAAFATFLRKAAEQQGASVREDSEVDEVTVFDDKVKVKLKGGDLEHFAKVVVNAAGPWIGSVPVKGSARRLPRAWCRAFNLVLDMRLTTRCALALPSKEGRVYLFTPRKEGLALGTEYAALSSNGIEAVVSEEEQVNFLNAASQSLPGVNLKQGRIVKVEAGVLPAYFASGYEVKLYGSYCIRRYGRYVDLISTKYTTFYSQAGKTLQHVKELLR